MSEGRFARFYDPAFGLFLRGIQNNIVNIIGKNKCRTIIDLGCGTGSQCLLLHKRGYNVMGLDNSKEMLSVARKKCPADINFILGDTAKIGISSKHFDCAILSFTIHPNTPSKGRKFLNEALRLIHDKGMIIATDYGIPDNTKGKIANQAVKIIENLAVKEHKMNYHRYIHYGGLSHIINDKRCVIIRKQKYYHGAIESWIIKKGIVEDD